MGISTARTGMLVLLVMSVGVVLTSESYRSLTSVSQVEHRQVTALRVSHRAGQTFITWREVGASHADPAPLAEQVDKWRAQPDVVKYRVYRSTAPIAALERATLIAEVPQLSGWNTAHEGRRSTAVARRYVVREGEPPLSLDHGVTVYSPASAGEAYYAVTAFLNGREQRGISTENVTSGPVREIVGPGEPVLQRRDERRDFMYVEQRSVLEYYVRWEVDPNTNAAGKPYRLPRRRSRAASEAGARRHSPARVGREHDCRLRLVVQRRAGRHSACPYPGSVRLVDRIPRTLQKDRRAAVSVRLA